VRKPTVPAKNTEASLAAGLAPESRRIRGDKNLRFTNIVRRNAQMAKVNVYIDGFNLYYGALKGSPYKWLDLSALCHRMLPNDTINSIEYFTAIVSARPHDPNLRCRNSSYLNCFEHRRSGSCGRALTIAVKYSIELMVSLGSIR